MSDRLPAPLREVLDADCLRKAAAPLSCVEGGFLTAQDRNADRARCVAATLRWAMHETPDFVDDAAEWCDWDDRINGAIALLEQEAS